MPINRNFFTFLTSICVGVFLSLHLAHAEAGKSTAILVDKKTNTLHVAEYEPDNEQTAYKILKTFHATLGQVKGDKRDEADLKTPEGIYYFTALLKPPNLKAKFGDMAFYINFPNEFDKMAGLTGNDIMLHATNEPDRLKKNYDSEGCIVVRNEEIEEIRPLIRIGLTPILIFNELTDTYLNPGKYTNLRSFFDNWVKAWETKDIETYIGSYHTDFVAQGKDLKAWKAYKSQLNRQYETIEVRPESVKYYSHPKYSVVTFTQNYRSTRKGGGIGHLSRGTKILYIAEELGQPKIVAETYTTLMW